MAYAAAPPRARSPRARGAPLRVSGADVAQLFSADASRSATFSSPSLASAFSQASTRDVLVRARAVLALIAVLVAVVTPLTGQRPEIMYAHVAIAVAAAAATTLAHAASSVPALERAQAPAAAAVEALLTLISCGIIATMAISIAATLVAMILLAAVLVIVRPSAVAAAAQVAGTLVTWALSATGGGRAPFAATPAEAVMLGAMAALCAGTWFLARARDRAAFCTAQSLADSWRTRLRVLTAALPLEIVPALVDHFDKAGAWSGAPATAALDVSIVFLRLPPLAHALFPRAPAAAVARLGELWAVVDAAFAAHGVATLEVTDTEMVGVVGLGGGGGDAAATVSAALAALAALPPDFAAAAVAGVNSGPVVCGFVGENRPRFTLVGDTMNTASRLATAAPPGKVTVSAAVRTRTVGHFDAVERVAYLKGKGDVAVFDVVGDSRASPSGSPLTVRGGGGGFSVRSVSSSADDVLVRSADDVGVTVGAAAGPSSGVTAETSLASVDDDAALVGAAGAAAPAGRPSTPAFSARFAPKAFSIYGFADAAVEARFSARTRQSGARYTIALFAFLALFVLLSGSPITPSAPGVATNIAGAVLFFAVAAAVALLPESSPAAAATTRAAYVFALAVVPLVAQRFTTAVLATCFLVAIPLDTLPALRVIALTAASCALLTALWRAGFYAEELATPAWPGPGGGARGVAIVAWVWIGFCVSSMGTLLMDATERARWAAADALVAVQGAGGAVLAALLPRPLIARLAAGADVAALTQEADGVALLCADISGFTALSASAASPARVFELLNDAFRDFERVAHAEGCEKIKTCGDAIIFAAGLPDAPGPGRDLADRVALLKRVARGMHAAAAQLALRLRVGIGTGRVVSGVLNTRGFIFDVWGAAFQEASDACNAAPPGRTALTAAAVAALGAAAATTQELEAAPPQPGGRALWLAPEAAPAAAAAYADDGVRVAFGDAPLARAPAGDAARDELLLSWTWDVFGGKGVDDAARLPTIALELLRPSFACGIEEAPAARAVAAALASYAALPFHNAFHAVATLQAVVMLERALPAGAGDPLNRFLLGFAALAHDAAHRGFTNAYEVAAASPIAAAYV